MKRPGELAVEQACHHDYEVVRTNTKVFQYYRPIDSFENFWRNHPHSRARIRLN